VNKSTTGRYSIKKYQCSTCNDIQDHGTNHWGEIYISCKKCSWKSPMDPIKIFHCLEPLPTGYDKPEPWKKVRLGDICQINHT
jgi:hypothetical protein